MNFNFEEDLRDLRKSVLIFIIPFIICLIVIFIYSKGIIEFFLKINNIKISDLITISPLESIQTQINLSIVVSLAICIPLILLSIYLFIEPILNKKLKVFTFISTSLVLSWIGFIVGSTIFSRYLFESFRYYQITGMMWSIKEVISLMLSFGISMSLIFQTMIVIPLIIEFGLISRKKLIRYSLIVFLIIAILSAIITPPDIFSQIIVSIPFYTSFWIGIIISKFTGGQNDRI